MTTDNNKTDASDLSAASGPTGADGIARELCLSDNKPLITEEWAMWAAGKIEEYGNLKYIEGVESQMSRTTNLTPTNQ